jgi:carboxymethylenebutenolidase
MSLRTLNEPEPAANPTIGRRGFLGGVAAASGFALATQPVTAQTIVTPADGLVAGMVEIGEERIAGYRAYPQGKASSPVVLVVSEIFGVHEHIKDLCRRLAKQGYYAIATQFFTRYGDVAAQPDIQAVMKIVAQAPDAQVMKDLDDSVALAKSEGALTDRLAITGFCWGGRIVWLYSAHNPALRCGVAWYGRVSGATDEKHPANPLDLAETIRAPILGLYGAKDTGIPIDDVEMLVAAVNKAGGKAELVAFPEAGHAFNADYRPSYRPKEAKEGWAKMLDWFKAYAV